MPKGGARVRSGPPPKPTSLRMLHGSRLPLNEKEPQPDPAIPKCPTSLSRRARAEWRRITPHLYKLGLLSEIDLGGLAGYCIAFGEVMAAEEKIAAEGRWDVEPNVVKARDEGLKHMRGYLAEFGLSPASRSRVKVDRPKGGELPEDEAFLRARGLKVVK